MLQTNRKPTGIPATTSLPTTPQKLFWTVQRKLLIPSLAVMIVLTLGLITYITIFTIQRNQSEATRDLTRTADAVETNIEELQTLALGLASEMANQPQVQAAFAEQNRQLLSEITLPTFQIVKEEFGVKQYQFILPPATSFLRLHQLDNYGDDLSSFRWTVLEANATQKSVSGIEIGRGGLGVRGEVPVFYRGEHIGVVDVGIDIGSDYLENLKKQYGIDVQILLEKEAAQTATFEGATSEISGPTPALLLQASTFKEPLYANPIVYERVLKGESVVSRLTYEGATYSVISAPLKDYSGRVIGVLEISLDRTEIIASQFQSLFLSILFGLMATVLGGFILARFITYTLRPINTLTEAAIAFAGGDLDSQIIIQSKDELGILANTFNNMAGRLRELVAGLEARVTERTQSLELAAEVGRAISQVRTLDAMLKNAVEIIRARFDLYYVQVYLTNPSRTALILQSGTGTVGAELLGRGHQLLLNTNSINGRAAVEKKSVLVPDTAHSASFKPNPLLPNTRSEMAVPLLVDEKVVGVLDIQSEHAGSLNQDILTAFEALAGQLAIAIQNATLLAEVQEAHVEVEKQAHRLVRANWVDYLDAIHKPEETGFIFEHNLVASFTGEEDIKDNALTAPISVTGEVLGNLVVEMEGQAPLAHTSELVNAVARQVAQQIESLRLLENAERYRAEAEAAARRLTHAGWETYLQQRPETRRYLYDAHQVRRLPAGDQAQQPVGFSQMLKVQGEAIGEIIVGDTQEMTQDSANLILIVAERLSAHVESLRLSQATETALAEVEQRAVELEALNRIVVNASASLNLQDVLPTIVREIAYLFKARDVVISQYQRDQRCLHVLADYDSKIDGSAITGTIIPVTDDDPVISVVETTKRSIVIPDAKNNPKTVAVRHIMIAKNIECLLVTPLLMRGEMIGTIAVDISDPERVFTPAEVKLAETIAAQLGGFLENTRLFQETQKRAERESMINTINQRVQSATTMESALETAAREIGHLLKARRTVVEIRTTPQNGQ